MQNIFDPLIIRGKSLIPIVQGGMGVGVSASGLSSAVARENGIGTIASVDLRHLHEDLLAESQINPSEEKYTSLNCTALEGNPKSQKCFRGKRTDCGQRDEGGQRPRRVCPPGLRIRGGCGRDGCRPAFRPAGNDRRLS